MNIGDKVKTITGDLHFGTVTEIREKAYEDIPLRGDKEFQVEWDDGQYSGEWWDLQEIGPKG